MAIELITGYAGEGHVSSSDAGRYNAGVCGTGQYVLNTGTKFAYTIESSNLITIGSGDAVDQGRHIIIPQNTTEDAEIQRGTQGKTRIDVIALRYEKNPGTGIESAALVVIKGTEVNSWATPTAPSVTSGNIFNGAAVDEMPLYHVLINGIQIESVTQVYQEIPSLATVTNFLYPVGAIYMSVNSTDPGIIFGGTWERISGRFLFGSDTSHAAGTTGGEEKHTLTQNEMPAHKHTGPSHTHSGPSHTHSGPSHTHGFTTGDESAQHTHGSGDSAFNFFTAKPFSSNSVGRRKIASGSSYYALTATGGTGDLGETPVTGSENSTHNHSGTTNSAGTGQTGASGTGQTGASGTGNTSTVGNGAEHNNMPPYLAVYMWKRVS